jgi:hypothetical protein
MIDPFAKATLEKAHSPIASDGLSPYLGISYLKKVAKKYFDGADDVDVGLLNEDLSNLSLAASLLSENDIETAFLIAEAAEIAFDISSFTKELSPISSIATIAHILDIASFFHLADFDANAGILAEKALAGLNHPNIAHSDEISSVQISYYLALGYYLRGKFKSLLNESQKQITATTTAELIFLRLIQILVELSGFYKGTGFLSNETLAEIKDISEILKSSGTHTTLSVEVSRIRGLSEVVKRKALFPLLISKIPEQKGYLDSRISGFNDYGYPFAWPPVREFCDKFLGSSDYQHAVITLPTGAGKSFLAELAIVNSIRDGWVLYLSPTNALCGQIRNDLSRNLIGVDNAYVDAAFGNSEYVADVTNLPTSKNHVIVMTPEKSALFFKIYPEKAKTCSLVILDECHLLGEKGRGDIAEFVIASLISETPNIHIILMSALVENIEDLGDWLNKKTGKDVLLLRNTWRPTRTSRVVLLQDLNRTEIVSDGVYSIPVIAAADPSTPWEKNTPSLFTWDVDLFIKSEDWKKFGWNKNEIAGDVAERLAHQGLKSLVVLFSNKLHVFSLAEKMNSVQDHNIEHSQKEFDWLQIANYELGIDSIAGTYIARKGISIHSNAILRSEQKASEDAFQRGRTKIMLCTTTLTQGLNLNAQVVILAGTTMFSIDAEEEYETRRRTMQQIINASGRAARANVACRGFSIIIPSEGYKFPNKKDFNDDEYKEQILSVIPILERKENSFLIGSQLIEVFKNVEPADKIDVPANNSELMLLSLLPFDAGSVARYVRSSLGSLEISDHMVENIINRIESIKQHLRQSGIPEYVLQSSSLANVDYRYISNLRQYIIDKSRENDFQINDTYQGWGLFLVEWLESMPIGDTWNLVFSHHVKSWRWRFGNKEQKDPDYIGNVRDGRINLDDESTEIFTPIWANLKTTLIAWLSDATLIEIGNTLVRGKCPDKDKDKRTSDGHLIPKAKSWSQDTIDPLSRLAGALSALREMWQAQSPNDIPQWLSDSKTLETLPMAIRFGVSNPTALAWYRFAIQERRVSNLLSQIIPLTIANPLDDVQSKIFQNQIFQYIASNQQVDELHWLMPVIHRRISEN